MTLFKTAIIVASLSLSATQLSAENSYSHDFPEEFKVFHHTLAPLWHMDKGTKRTKLSCGATDRMLVLAKKIANSERLASAIISMNKLCGINSPKIEGAFKNVHDAFHKLNSDART